MENESCDLVWEKLKGVMEDLASEKRKEQHLQELSFETRRDDEEFAKKIEELEAYNELLMAMIREKKEEAEWSKNKCCEAIATSMEFFDDNHLIKAMLEAAEKNKAKLEAALKGKGKIKHE